MARTPIAPMLDQPAAQPPLIPLSAEELQTAARRLATRIRDLEEMEIAHKAQREAMKADRETLREEIAAIASTIREHGR